MYVIVYLIAIVLANLSIARFGPSAAVVNAFLFIGLDLTTRDRLHDLWRGQGLWLRMAALIIAGSVLSWLLNRDAGPIAIASFVAFMTATTVDAIAYQALGKYPKWIRVNGSNIPSAAVDSMVFPAMAFGLPLMWPIVLGQFVAKVLGGAIWSIVLSKRTILKSK